MDQVEQKSSSHGQGGELKPDNYSQDPGAEGGGGTDEDPLTELSALMQECRTELDGVKTQVEGFSRQSRNPSTREASGYKRSATTLKMLINQGHLLIDELERVLSELKTFNNKAEIARYAVMTFLKSHKRQVMVNSDGERSFAPEGESDNGSPFDPMTEVGVVLKPDEVPVFQELDDDVRCDRNRCREKPENASNRDVKCQTGLDGSYE